MALTAEQWEQIESLLPEALKLAPAELQRFLDRHCPQALRADIESLVAAGDVTDGALDQPVALTAPEDSGQSLADGVMLGHWRVDSLLGAGGMGEVYAAERADGSYEQRVAIKLLKRGIDTQAVLRRFLRERRILARLAHPNIARLLDAGAADDGRPYLVMERVDGLPIDQWCEHQALPLRQRLELMCAVCEAVYAAHREQIVHRDLKPSNVLVSQSGEVKLLDFGVSKLTGEDDRDGTQTMLGSAPLTPDYATPEQLLAQPVTPATDVYALGLLLYRLLTGELPHSRKSLTAALTAASKEDRIARPSVTLRRKQAAIDRKARMETRALARELDGDIDQIVLKALQREPARRYANAAELADDLRRYLDGRPVLARPDAWLYVARKFVVRNWVPVSAVMTVAAALIVGLTVALWQARVAQAQAQRAERVKNFVVSVFAEQDPFTRGTVQARAPQQMLADAAARLDQELGGEPDLHAELLDDLGGVQASLGDLNSSRTLLERAVREQTQRHGGQSLAVARSLTSLAHTLNRLGLPADAVPAAQRALSILQSHRDADPIDVAKAERELAYAISFNKGAPPEAERLFGDALRIFESVRGPDDLQTLQTLFEFEQMHNQARQQDRAEAEVGELIARSRRRYGEHSVAFGRALVEQGLVQASGNKLQASVDAYAQGIAILRSQLSDQDTTIGTSVNNMATQLRELRRFEEAQAAYAEAERMLPETATARRDDIMRGEGLTDLSLGRNDEGEQLLHAAYTNELKDYGEGSPKTWYFAGEWGRGLAAQGKLAQAETVQREALTRLGAIMGPTAYQNALLMRALADTLEQQKDRRAEAEALRRESLQIVASKYPDTEPRWADYAQQLAHTLAGADTAAANAEGLSLCEKIVSIYTRSPPGSEDLAESQLEYAGFLDRAGRRNEARQQLASALQNFQKTQNPDADALKRAQALQRQLGAA
jgi:serine/threonine-protein kinase